MLNIYGYIIGRVVITLTNNKTALIKAALNEAVLNKALNAAGSVDCEAG